MATDILFVHASFPGRLRWIVEALAARGARLRAIGSLEAENMPPVKPLRWGHSRGTTPGVLADAARFEADLIRGNAAANAAKLLKQEGFEPQVIIGHPGWGELIFLRDIFPKARFVVLAEKWHGAADALSALPYALHPKPLTEADMRQARARNAGLMMQWAEADRIVCPSRILAAQLPRGLRSRITLIRDGADCAQNQPNPEARLLTPVGVLSAADRVLTFIAPALDAANGFVPFARMVPHLLAADSHVRIVVSGQVPQEGLPLPLPADERVIMLPHAPAVVKAALQTASLHLHLRPPALPDAVLMTAMAVGAPILASDHAFMREMLIDGRSAVLTGDLEPEALATLAIRLLDDGPQRAALGAAAHELALARFDSAKVHDAAWLKLMATMLGVPYADILYVNEAPGLVPTLA